MIMRQWVVMLTATAVLATGSAVGSGAATSVSATGGLPPSKVGCVSAAASFTGEAYCLDGNHPLIVTNAAGTVLTDSTLFYGELELNGWQVPTRCNGNGTSGKREQLVYVHVKGTPDTYQQDLPFILKRLIPGANGVFEHTTGGKRAVRWVTTKTATGCVPTVLRVTVPKSANTFYDGFDKIGSDVLRAVGGVNPNRSYLVLVDHPDGPSGYIGDCGLGQVRPDNSPGAGNRSNKGGAFAMVWSNCWTGLVTAHELTHTLGAVQPQSPHHTDNGHCWDGRDDMCYNDGSRQQQRVICTKQDDYRKLDCNGDDYFALYPKPGSYLASHWNSANSQFLIASKPTVLPTRPAAPTVTVTAVDAHHVRVSWVPGVTKHGAITSWTVQIGATDGGTFESQDGAPAFPLVEAPHQVTVGGKARSTVIVVKPDLAQGFAVHGTNASGDGVTSAIVEGGAGNPPTPIVGTVVPSDGFNQPYVTWTGGTSASSVTTCSAVLVNGNRVDYIDAPTDTLANTTDPLGRCYSDYSSYTQLPSTLQPTDVVQVYARNAFGSTLSAPIAH